MILILSESNDLTTSAIIEWLLTMNKTVVRINECDAMQAFTLSGEDAVMQFRQLSTGRTLHINTRLVEMFWFRKQGFNLRQWLDQKFEHAAISKYIDSEMRICSEYVYYLLSQKPNLAMSFNCSLNKLVVNHIARELGLVTPLGVVSTERKVLENFLQQEHDGCITKAISESFFVQAGSRFMVSYTEPVQAADLGMYGTDMMPALLQRKVVKRYELRIFYLNGTCYATAIFSQRDKQTETDFRKYNYAKPNRTVPFALPAQQAEKLHLLMQRLKLKTGSIDMLVSATGEYIFLEVNPVGQFGMVSEPGNYYLEKKVAQYLATAAT